MRQGASKSALAERGNDLYETPEVCVTSAFRAGVFNAALRAGRGVISRTLLGFGLDVVAQDLVAYDGADPDIATPIDFLMEQRAPEGVGAAIALHRISWRRAA